LFKTACAFSLLLSITTTLIVPSQRKTFPPSMNVVSFNDESSSVTAVLICSSDMSCNSAVNSSPLKRARIVDSPRLSRTVARS
jgi:hypothetical protein